MQAYVAHSLDLTNIFYEIDVNNFVRAMAYLTLVYLTNAPEDEMHQAVCLVATVLKDMDFTAFKIDECFPVG